MKRWRRRPPPPPPPAAAAAAWNAANFCLVRADCIAIYKNYRDTGEVHSEKFML